MAACERCGKDAGVVSVGTMTLCAGCGASIPSTPPDSPPPAAAPQPAPQAPAPQAPAPQAPASYTPAPPTEPRAFGSAFPASGPPRQPPPPGAYGAPQPGYGAPPPGPGGWGQPAAPYGAWTPAPKKKRSALAIVGIVVASVVGVLIVLGVAIALLVNVDDNRADEAIGRFAAGETETIAYTAPDGKWTIAFPSDPTQDVTTQPLPGTDALVEFNLLTARQGRLYVFEAGYLEVPPDYAIEPDAYLGLMTQMLLDGTGGELLYEQPAAYGFLPARDLAFTFYDDQVGKEAVAVSRLVVSGNRLYIVSLTADNEEQAAFEAFVASFQILG